MKTLIDEVEAMPEKKRKKGRAFCGHCAKEVKTKKDGHCAECSKPIFEVEFSKPAAVEEQPAPVTDCVADVPPMIREYREFLAKKNCIQKGFGLPCSPDEVHPNCKPVQKAIIPWAVEGGRRAIFGAFGLGKTVMQLEIARIIMKKRGGMALIVMPLGVVDEFIADAENILGMHVEFIRKNKPKVEGAIYLTNYESVREGKVNPRKFTFVSLDEGNVLRGFGGTKNFRELMKIFEGSGIDRCVATATPSPNDYIELLAYACFLDVMDVSEAKTRFFKRDSTKADNLVIHPGKEREFWLWVSSWAVFVQKPSDLGFDDVGYDIPPLDVQWHVVESDNSTAGWDKHTGQGRLIADASIGVSEASKEKRSSLEARAEKLKDVIRCRDKSDQLIVWCDLDDEQKAIGRALDELDISYVSLYGKDSIDKRQEMMKQWKRKEVCAFVSKPSMYGSGCNLQQCHTMIFFGIGFKFNEFIQAIHRIQRFNQKNRCTIHIIHSEAEQSIKEVLCKKWEQHKTLVAEMTGIIKQYGLSAESLSKALERKMGCERQEKKFKNALLINNDCVEEAVNIKTNSIGLILTSIPFSTQYEYSPSFNDFGHTDDNTHFWLQMDFVIPQWFRMLIPGRIAAIHVKDRITPGHVGNNWGFQSVQGFHFETYQAMIKHGFAYMGMITIVTDVVRENNQTYRLGWTKQCRDGSAMGVGMPEYLMIFRKPPTDNTASWSDIPVVKGKREWVIERDADGSPTGKRHLVNPNGYARCRWQFDAHGYHRSSGNRLLMPEDFKGLAKKFIYRLYKKHSLETVYDFEHEQRLGVSLDDDGMLPTTFMLLQPTSHNPQVWTDVARMRTLNMVQQRKGFQFHLCPMQFDVADRAIEQWSNKGETVYDPFGGIGTVPLQAAKLGRFGMSTELNPAYFQDACWHIAAHERLQSEPFLFDMEELDDIEEQEETVKQLEDAM